MKWNFMDFVGSSYSHGSVSFEEVNRWLGDRSAERCNHALISQSGGQIKLRLGFLQFPLALLKFKNAESQESIKEMVCLLNLLVEFVCCSIGWNLDFGNIAKSVSTPSLVRIFSISKDIEFSYPQKSLTDLGLITHAVRSFFSNDYRTFIISQ